MMSSDEEVKVSRWKEDCSVVAILPPLLLCLGLISSLWLQLASVVVVVVQP